MRRLAICTALLGALTMSTGCESGPCPGAVNELEGSIGELYDIDVDNVEARWSEFDDTVTVDFKNGTDSHAKVVANMVSSASIGDGIPLISGDVFRLTSEEENFPREIARGTVTFTSALNPGEEVTGCFRATFIMEDESLRTLEGVFQTTLENLEDF